MEERDKKTELLVGLFLFVGLVLLGLLILQFGAVRELFKTTYEVSVPFADGTGIKEGTPVMLGGQRIGKVPRNPELNDKFNGVVIPLEVYHEMKIPKDAKFSIGRAGLLGDSYIEIRPTGAHTNEYFGGGDRIPDANVAQAGGMSALADKADVLAKKVEDSLTDIQATVKKLQLSLDRVNNGALAEKSMEDLKSTIAHLNNIMVRMDEKTLNEDTSKDLKEIVASFKEAAASLNGTVKKLEPAAGKVDSVMTKLDDAAGKVDGVVTKADTVMATATTALKTANTAIEDYDKIAKMLGKGKGEGLLPALLNDGELKNEFQMLISNLRRHGILWFRDDAAEEQKKEREAIEKARQQQRSLFRP